MAKAGKSTEVGAAHISLEVEGADKVVRKLDEVEQSAKSSMRGVEASTKKTTEGVSQSFDNMAGSVDRGIAKFTKVAGVIGAVVGAVTALSLVLKPLIAAFDKAGAASTALGESLSRVDFSNAENAVQGLSAEVDNVRNELGRLEGERTIRSLVEIIVGKPEVLESTLGELESRLEQAIKTREKLRTRALAAEVEQINISLADDPVVKRELERQRAIDAIRQRQRDAATSAEKSGLDILLEAQLRQIDTLHERQMAQIRERDEAEKKAAERRKTQRLRDIAEEKTAELRAIRDIERQMKASISSAVDTFESRIESAFGLDRLETEVAKIADQLAIIEANTGGI